MNRGFTLVEVLVSLLLLSTALLGMVTVAAAAQRALSNAALHERSVRHAAALLDSLFVAGPGMGRDTRGGVDLEWESGEEIVVTAAFRAGGPPVRLAFRAVRAPRLPERAP